MFCGQGEDYQELTDGGNSAAEGGLSGGEQNDE